MQLLKDWKIGFIGLGLMGKPMARNLLNAGACVTIYNRSRDVINQIREEGFIIADSIAEVAKLPQVICMVSDTEAVQSVVLGNNGILMNASPSTLVIDMGTTEVRATHQMAAQLQKAGLSFIDAPVSGGEVGAIQASLSIMVGAKNQEMKYAKPIFETLGRQVVHVGEVGAGQIAKAANQVIVGLTIGAVAEAFALARDGGADLNKVWQALAGGFADSRILQVHGRRMIEQNYKPGGKATTQRKDLEQALTFATTNETELPATTLCRDLYDQLIDQGDGDLDHSALFRIYRNDTYC